MERLAPRPADRPLAVFDALGEWFASDDFRGCAFINAAVGDRRSGSPRPRGGRGARAAAGRVPRAELLRGAGLADPADDAAALLLLVEGAIVSALIERTTAPAARARAAAARILTTPRERGGTMSERIAGFRLGIYVFKDAEIVDFAAPHGVFSVARRFDPELDAFLIADSARPVQAQAGFTVLPNYSFADRPDMDAFLIPGRLRHPPGDAQRPPPRVHPRRCPRRPCSRASAPARGSTA